MPTVPGVCQDFAHLALALAKAVGLPSRYVSGYFHPEADATIGEEVTGESHAWVEVWTGRWWGYDPTNDCAVGERHIAVGRGRDYSRRAAGQGDLRRERRERHAGGGAHDEDALSRARGADTVLTRMRIWLPDAPGVLGAVAAEIGAVEGNVVGLEVLEREAGVAIDELVVELPDEPGAVDAVCRGVRNVPGAGVEEVTELSPRRARPGGHGPGRGGGHPPAATPPAAMHALAGHLMALFDLSWLALADEDLTGFVEVHGDVPSVQWVAAFAEGSRSGADPANDTTRSGVFVEPVPETGLTVCGGRPVAIRRRERHEIAMLVMVAARFMDALDGGRSSAHRPWRIPST